jgi:hypothetical protein
MFLTVFMIKFRSLRENESIIAPCAWTSESNGSECGVFVVVTKTREDTDNDYTVAGSISRLLQTPLTPLHRTALDYTAAS